MDDIRFVDHNIPRLSDGTYRIRASLVLDPGAALGGARTHVAPDQLLTIGTPQHALSAEEVLSVFPDPRAQKDVSTVLPHIVLRDAQLPWTRHDRQAGITGHAANATPKLALLLFGEEEARGLAFAKAGALQQVTLPAALLLRAAPLQSELADLAHVRDLGGGDTRAVVLCGRLPEPACRNTCLLVDISKLYANGTDIVPQGTVGDVSLPVLHRWAFTCLAGKAAFGDLMQPVEKAAGPLRLPALADPAAEAHAARGATLLPLHRRSGAQTATLYRGPLATGGPDAVTSGAAPDPWSVRTADALSRYVAADGLLDITYSAAWELGRLLGLSSEGFARALAAHRRSALRQEFAARALGADAALAPLAAAAHLQAPAAPDALAQMLERLAMLRDVPFAYLVPDAAMLPPESLRLFRVDPGWLDALLAGALSLGRVANDPARAPDVARPSFGLLLRSEAVTLWPRMVVEAETAAGTRLTPVRLDPIGPGILLALFTEPPGDPADSIQLHLHPEVLHHGLEHDAATGGYSVALRDATGLTGTEALLGKSPFHPGDTPPSRRLDLAALRAALAGQGALPAGQDGPAGLAFQLVQSSYVLEIALG